MNKWLSDGLNSDTLRKEHIFSKSITLGAYKSLSGESHNFSTI